MIQNLGEIEQIATNYMYTEQSWVEQLLKRVRNEADSATKDFHNYLMEQLLTVTNKIMTSLQKQDQSVKELSTKMDKNFDGWTQKLDSFLDDQNKLRQAKSQKEQEFFAGLENRNMALSTAFDQDTVDFEEYFKKSSDFNEKIMSLIKVEYQILTNF